MAKIYYHAVPADWRKEQKYKFLDEHDSVSKIDWTEITPDAKQNWLTAGMEKEFDGFISICTRRTEPNALFGSISRGVETTRDNWVYNFQKDQLTTRIKLFIETYNSEVARWNEKRRDPQTLDSFLISDGKKIKWSRLLKQKLQNGEKFQFDEEKIRPALFRPFTQRHLYFSKDLVYLLGVFPKTFPNKPASQENLVITLSDQGLRSPFSLLISNSPADLHLCSSIDAFQSFPYYLYNEDGTNRRENITDWALEQFREHYRASSGSDNTAISKWNIFYYTYAILHHPKYREKYAANLKRELPRIPFAPDFWSFAKAGKELADIHVNYEASSEYKLDMHENAKLALDWRVGRMKYNKEKTAIVYNEFLTISGIPPEVHEYRLGNRSALDWIVDQYKVSIDKRSGITNDPNRDDDKDYIVRLIKKIVTVSLRTNEIVKSLPALAEA